MWLDYKHAIEKTLQKYLGKPILFLNEKETHVRKDWRSLLKSSSFTLSAANVRKFKADSFVIDDKFNVTLAVKRAADTSTNEAQPDVKKMKTEDPPIEIPSEVTKTFETAVSDEPTIPEQKQGPK
jgi:hypothetical protein